MGVALRQRTRVTGTSVFLICVSIFLTAYTTRHPEIGRMTSSFSEQLLAPFQRTTVGVVSWWTELANHYILLVDVQTENNELRKKLMGFDRIDSELDELRFQNKKLQTLLEMKESQKVSGIVATVIAYNPSRWVEGVTLNRGSLDGVVEGMAVVNEAGVVGHVVSVSPRTARVLLVIDRVAGADAFVQSTRTRGVVRGRGTQQCELEYVLSSDEVEVGQKVLTSGLDGIFPKSFLIGVISSIKSDHKGMFQRIKVDPVVDFNRLEDVLIVVNSRETEFSPQVDMQSMKISEDVSQLDEVVEVP
jgi:rod shape-determining protein MreC